MPGMFRLALQQEARQEVRQAPMPMLKQGLLAKQMLAFAGAIANVHSNVLLLGERGVGKDYLAKMIHLKRAEPRGPFVVVDCAALPETLLETELFGHHKGAYTGAHERKKGLVETAAGGTLFLNEIGEVPIHHQAAYMRLVEERTFRVIGSTQEHQVNARIIAATNVIVEEAIEKGKLRGDLVDRLDQLTFRVPALRNHKDDIPVLAQEFLWSGAVSKRFSVRAIEVMMDYHWPGNIRQLGNVVKKVSLDLDIRPSDEDEIVAERVIPHLPEGGGEWMGVKDLPPFSVLEKELFEKERSYLYQSLSLAGGRIRKAAMLIGVSRTTLNDKIERFGLSHLVKSNENARLN